VRLTRDLVKVCGENRLKRFYERNLEILYLLEKAYTFKISAQEYDKDIAERILKVFLEKTMNFLFPLRFKTKKSR